MLKKFSVPLIASSTKLCVVLCVKYKFLIMFLGTGKSETGAHLAYFFALQNRGCKSVLYCGPSNKAVDVVHGKYMNYG